MMGSKIIFVGSRGEPGVGFLSGWCLGVVLRFSWKYLGQARR